MLHPQPIIAAAALAAMLLFVQAPLAAAPGAAKPFDILQGAWSGNGSITLGSGDKERIRCRANYAVDGNHVRQELRCASDSYKFEMQNDLTYNDGHAPRERPDLRPRFGGAHRSDGGNERLCRHVRPDDSRRSADGQDRVEVVGYFQRQHFAAPFQLG